MKLLGCLQSRKSHQDALREEAMALHSRIVEEVLAWTAKGRLGLEDGFASRFEVMVLAVAVVLFALAAEEKMSQDKSSRKDLSQGLWDMTFEGFEESLRQRGVTDIRIGARMRVLLQNAMGRRNAYVDAMKDEKGIALHEAVVRNVFNGAVGNRETVEMLLSSVLKLPARVLGNNSNPYSLGEEKKK